MNCTEVIEALHLLANGDLTMQRKAKFGIISRNALGITMKELNEVAKQLKKNTSLGLELIATDIYEAKLLAAKIINPKDVTQKQMDTWVLDFDNWEYCDTFCMQVFSATAFAEQKIMQWSASKYEFVKRAAFATLASLCMEDKLSVNAKFIPYFQLIKDAATDERLYVKKAVNWALRGLGKRNIDMHKLAIAAAEDILLMDNKAAKWIAKDALTEFNKENMRLSQYPRSVYKK
jgi:3-methyladenine DNA glycosylase AlkD